MPQDGSNNYQYPPGTPGIPDTTIESEAYNTFLDDLVTNDLNIPRPIHRGGTGANSANTALANLTAEKATQLVTDYGSHVWLPGSFYSATTATAPPVASHAFAGICYINEPLAFPPTNANVTVEARDMTDGKLYVRQKTTGVWGAWVVQAGGAADLDAAYVNAAGDTMTGFLTLSAAPTATMHAATKQYVDGGVDGVTGGLTSKVAKAGGADGIMTGFLTLHADPDAALKAATKQYVDAVRAATAPNDNVIINGDFRVSQYGYVSAAVLAAGIYGHDQWKAGAAGGDYSFTQLKSSTQITIASGKTLIQPIEDINVVGGSYILSWTGTAQARAGVNTLTPSGAYAASPLLITGQTAGRRCRSSSIPARLGLLNLKKDQRHRRLSCVRTVKSCWRASDTLNCGRVQGNSHRLRSVLQYRQLVHGMRLPTRSGNGSRRP